MITVESLTKKYGGFTAVDDVTLHRPARPGHRLPRPQRRRQVHDDAGHGRAHAAPRPAPPRSAAAASPTCPTRASRSASCSTPPRSTPAAPAARSSPSPQRTMGLPARRVDEMLDLVSLTPDGGRPPGARLLARHAPAARHRHRAARRARGADPRRAGQRPRPGRHPLDARPAARLRRPRRAPCCSPRTCCTRSRSSPTTWSSSASGRIVAQGTKAELLAAAGTLVRTRRRAPTWPRALDRRRHRPPPPPPADRRPARRRRPRARRHGRPAGRRRARRAPRRRRRRARGDVPRAHRRHPTRRSSSMTTA